MTHSSSSRLLPTAFLIMVGVLAFHQIADSDFWLHRAAGDFILAHRQIPQQNQFSFTHPHHPWIDVYWLYQILVSQLWHVGGAPAIVVLKTLLALGLAALVLFGLRDRQQPLSFAEGVILGLGWLVMTPRLTDRPELISFVLLAAMLALLRAGRWWWCVLLQILWANVQGYFYWGVLLLAMWTVGQLWEGRRTAARAAGWATLASILASALSPFTWHNWLLGWGFAGTLRGFRSSIDELAGPFHPAVWARDGNSLLLVVFIAVVALLAITRRQAWTPFDRLLAVASLLPALVAQRAAPVFVLCVLPAVLASVRPRDALERPWLRLALAAGMILFAMDFAVGTGVAARFRGNGRVFGWRVAEQSAPSRAVAALRELSPAPQRVLNAHFHTGGYLLAATNLDLPVFIDGRLEAYPPEFIHRYLQMFSDDRVFDQLVEQFAITHLFLVKDVPEVRQLGERLRHAGTWRLIYADDQAEIYERPPTGSRQDRY